MQLAQDNSPLREVASFVKEEVGAFLRGLRELGGHTLPATEDLVAGIVECEYEPEDDRLEDPARFYCDIALRNVDAGEAQRLTACWQRQRPLDDYLNGARYGPCVEISFQSTAGANQRHGAEELIRCSA